MTSPRPRAAALACVIAAAGSALAEDAVSPAELQQLLRQRDAVIIELLRRVETLERRLVDVDDEAAPPAPPVPVRPPPAAPAASPGAFEVDPEAAERALERTLVERGALLLMPGQAEIAPRFRYTRASDAAPVILTVDGVALLTEDDFERNIFDGSLALRVGLPFESQLELDLPYRYVRQSRTPALDPQAVERRDGGGLRDLSLGMAKTLLHESGWRPDLVGRVAWDTTTGRERDGDVFLGGSFHELGLDLTATKRLDPLVFVAGASYQTAFRRNNIRPGDQYGLSLGALLAASPEASLRLFLDQTYADETKVGGSRVRGSDALASTFNVGTSVVLGPRLLLDVAAGIGLTGDAPDYSVRVALPFRFDMPLPR